MTDLVTQDRDPKPTRDRAARMGVDDVVTANGLATHLGMTRQNVARLTAEAVIEQRADGCYDQTASRLRYIKHLRAEHRRSPKAEAEAEHAAAKAALLRIRIAEKQRELVRQEDVDALVDTLAGIVLTNLSGLSARCSRDLQVRRTIDSVVLQIRREMAEAALAKADEWNEPPLNEQ